MKAVIALIALGLVLGGAALYLRTPQSGLLISGLLPSALLTSVLLPQPSLTEFHAELAQRYPEVQHVTPAYLAGVPAQEKVVFDVREAAEYQTSHIKNAIHVDPSVSALEFLAQHEDTLLGKTAVFYCSVGERSSRLAQAVLRELDAPAHVVVNLQGGIFAWSNQSYPVYSGGEITKTVHPFNARWGRLLNHP